MLFKELLLEFSFLGLFEDYRTYGLDIPRRLHARRDIKGEIFIPIEEIENCEMAWYKIVGLLRKTYML